MNKFSEVFGAKGLAAWARLAVLRNEALKRNNGDLEKSARTLAGKILDQLRPRDILTLLCHEHIERILVADGQIGEGHGSHDAQPGFALSASSHETGGGGQSGRDIQAMVVPAAEPETGAAGQLNYDTQPRIAGGSQSNDGGEGQTMIAQEAKGAMSSPPSLSEAGRVLQIRSMELRKPPPGKPRDVHDIIATGYFVCRLSTGEDLMKEKVRETKRRFDGSFFDQALRYQVLHHCEPPDDSAAWEDLIKPDVMGKFKQLAAEYQELVLRKFYMSIEAFLEAKAKTAGKVLEHA